MIKIRIKNLRLRAIIGAKESERKNKQDVIINVSIDADPRQAIETDNIDEAFNYRTMTKNIIAVVENSRFHLLEKLADSVLSTVMEDGRVKSATVEIDKPGALRFTDSVSIEVHANR